MSLYPISYLNPLLNTAESANVDILILGYSGCGFLIAAKVEVAACTGLKNMRVKSLNRADKTKGKGKDGDYSQRSKNQRS